MSETQKSSAKKIVFLIVFLDLVGFGIFITLSPFLALQFKASAFEIGLLMSCYSIAQFIFSPFWGKMSDRYGRRPILLLSILGGSLSYLGFAFSYSLWWMFLCRSFAGLFAANISTAHAVITDVTAKEDRAAGMGLIGAAFGLGFIVGPSLGSAFGYIGNLLGSHPPFGLFFPALMAFVITFLNLIWAYFALPETNTFKHKEERRESFMTELSLMNKTKPMVFRLILVFFLANLAMPLMEVMLFPFVKDRFGWGFVESGIGFAVVGLVMAFTQGLLVRRLIPKWGERKTLLYGFMILAFAYFLISMSFSIVTLAFAMFLLALGSGLSRPSLLGMVSMASRESEQGEVMGSSQSAASLGRILGPMLGGWLYSNLGMGSPFILAGILTVVSIIAVSLMYVQLPDQLARSSQ
ncbi:MAG: MFS transporter [Bdellovibrionaceae bacterium]|nr:MFS transporter [Pseudobdellovibrionaceae bacterium]